MEIVPVYARALTDEHLPMIDGHVAEIVSAARMGEQMALRWVPAGADLDVEPEITEYPLDELVPVIRRADWQQKERTVTHTYRDRSSWPAGPWDGEPDHAEWRDQKTGLPCLAHRNGMGAWCGYVGINPGHPWHGVHYDGCPTACGEFYCEHSPAQVDVHGGLTYADRCQEGPEGEVICHVPEPGESADVWWFGFDTAHAGDLVPGVPDYDETYRTLGYVQAECRSLAQQLAEVTAR